MAPEDAAIDVSFIEDEEPGRAQKEKKTTMAEKMESGFRLQSSPYALYQPILTLGSTDTA